LIQESIRPDSIVAYSYSTASARRLLQQNRPGADIPPVHRNPRQKMARTKAHAGTPNAK
jgi:hypothetical protein